MWSLFLNLQIGKVTPDVSDSEGEEDELFFIWPTTIIHKINQDSPFYDMSAKDFLKKRYEIVVILEGVVEQTGNSIQVHTTLLSFSF